MTNIDAVRTIRRALFQAWCRQYAGRASRASSSRLHAAMESAMDVLPAGQIDAIMDAATQATEAQRERAYRRSLRRGSLQSAEA